LRIGSPLFHFGMLGVVGGHIVGLLVPQSWTDAVGISHTAYHVVAVTGGLAAGVMTVVGMAILIYRRRTVGPVFSATTVMDKVMYAFLAVVIFFGMCNTIAGSIMTIGGEYNYREGVSVWYRSFLAFNPDASLMADAPLGFQLHALVAFGLFALWPFTRLVHVFSAPVGYVTRPYIVYRSRDDHLGSHRPRRGWDNISQLTLFQTSRMHEWARSCSSIPRPCPPRPRSTRHARRWPTSTCTWCCSQRARSLLGP